MKLKRINEGPNFVVEIRGIEIPIDNGYGTSDEILNAILKLDGIGFEEYKVFISENSETFHLIGQISTHYGNGYEIDSFGKFMSLEVINSLLETRLLTESERLKLLALIEKKRKNQAREAKRFLPTFIYLMRDERTNFYKIGKSSNPRHREKTLQSDNPLVVLVDSWIGVSSDEKRLHKRFEAKRIRGEWFNLDENDIQKIYKFFADKSQSEA